MLQIARPTAPPVPAVFDSPHSGCSYPPDFKPDIDIAVLRRAEDAHVERLFAHVAGQGAPLLYACFPRSYIDVNRALDDLDSDLIEGSWPHPVHPSVKSRGGKGLIWRTVQLTGEIYRRKLTVAEVEARIETCWRPYHAALRDLLDEAHHSHGRVLHINCHSMRSQGHARDPDGAVARPDMVLGDRDGASCAPEITQFAAETLRDMGYAVSVNDPYKGMELVRAYADPAAGRHSLMIEINRRLYMNEVDFEPLASFAELQRNLSKFTGMMIARFSERR